MAQRGAHGADRPGPADLARHPAVGAHLAPGDGAGGPEHVPLEFGETAEVDADPAAVAAQPGGHGGRERLGQRRRGVHGAAPMLAEPGLELRPVGAPAHRHHPRRAVGDEHRAQRALRRRVPEPQPQPAQHPGQQRVRGRPPAQLAQPRLDHVLSGHASTSTPIRRRSASSPRWMSDFTVPTGRPCTAAIRG